MNKLTTERRAQIISLMVEGVSIRAITRMTGVSKNTVAKLIVDAGQACAEYQDKTFHNLKCQRIQCDEIWCFCYAKEKNVPQEKRGVLGYGDVYTWTAIDADSKLVPCWFVGRRDAKYAKLFIDDLASRLANRVQLTTDGHKAYLSAVENAFGANVDYAMLVKLYGAPQGKEEQRRCSPGECQGTIKGTVSGNPDKKHISTSFVERQNLTMRMSMRRFTRLTNAFSKKIENHEYMIAIYFMHYNFVRTHQSLRVTPAMAAGISNKLWSLEDMVGIVDEWEAAQKSN